MEINDEGGALSVDERFEMVVELLLKERRRREELERRISRLEDRLGGSDF
jgi:BMFP domain-containing protein YqiC